ncbi:MAG TPA: hypothetical protein VN256_05350 [Pyrinomonadaceae bacterium]|nr:hypothetical protein [Pyrinomonadaceae bacterium]
MAHRCSGTWFSWINPSTTTSHPPEPHNDGEIVANPVGGTGDFDGTHKGKKIKGKCKESSPNIKFDRVEGDCVHTYWGDISRDVVEGNEIDVVRGGKHEVKCKETDGKTKGRKAAPPVVPDDWVAEKQT